MDSGYESYQDARLAYPPDVSDRDPEDEPLTRELRDELDRAGIRYTCGWLMGDHHINTTDTTIVWMDNAYVSIEEDADEGRLYVEIDGGLKLDTVVAMLRAACGK